MGDDDFFEEFDCEDGLLGDDETLAVALLEEMEEERPGGGKGGCLVVLVAIAVPFCGVFGTLTYLIAHAL